MGVDGVQRAGGEFEPFYVPRTVMPQLDAADYGEFFEFCKAQNVGYDRLYVDPSILRPHQRVDHDRARKMDEDTFNKPIMSAADLFILDGHHRWYEHKINHANLWTFSLYLEFEKAVAFMFTFPKVYAYGDGQQHEVTL